MTQTLKSYLTKISTSALALLLLAQSTPPSQASTFSDVATDAWYYSYVTDMASQGFVSGLGDGTYAPASTLSVAAFATMLSNGFYGDSLKTIGAMEGSWWLPYMEACYQRKGLIGTCASDKDNWASVATSGITRYDVAAMIYDLIIERGCTPLTNTQKMTIATTISDDIPLEYATAVATVYHYKFMTGRSDGSFDGTATLTRGEAAVVLSALVNSSLIQIEK